MKHQEIKTKYAQICNSLASRRLKPAFDLLGKLISENSLGIYYDEYRSLEETYHFMLKYTVEGTHDPERKKVYRKLIVSAFELTDLVNDTLHMKFSPSLEYEKKRFFKNSLIYNLGDYLAELESFYTRDDIPSPGNKTNLRMDKGPLMSNENVSREDEEVSPEDKANYKETAKEHQQKIRRLFYQIWLTDKIKSEESEPLRNFLLNPIVRDSHKSLLVSALMLSLQRFFDPEKFNLLFDTYSLEEAGIKQRALVGLLINLYKFDERMPFYPSITGRLKILNESLEFKRNLERIIVQLIRSKETEKLQKRIRDEILPEMIKLSPNMKNKINLDSLMAEGLPEDKNPAWEEIFKDKPGLLNKMEEFSEMQMKGSDVFMGSFAMLKSFTFFNEIDNWFMPFFPENPEIVNTIKLTDASNMRLVEAIGRASILCNSDKYSFCLSIPRIPKDNLEFMSHAMNAEMDQLNEHEDDEVLLDPGRKEEAISNQYIQDLYRFYKLFPRKGDFEDIFNWKLDFHNKLALGNILKEDHKVLRNIAEYYFAKYHFAEAAEIFGYLLEQEKNGELYQKIAYCHQKMCDFETALDGYLKAELYEVNQLWNLKKIAICYHNLKQPAKALEYYQAAEKIDPDNLSNQLNIGQCLLELDKFDEALKCYFKVEYLAPGNKKVWRPIAWCSFLVGKKDQAEKYFLKLMEDQPIKHDFINMGHVQWSLGNRKAALDYYQKSISESGFSEAEFLEVFEEDLPHLLNQGIDIDDIPIMLDQLRYFLEEH